MKKVGRIDWVAVATYALWIWMGVYMFLKFWRFI